MKFKISEKIFHSEINVVFDDYEEYKKTVTKSHPETTINWKSYDGRDAGAMITIGLSAYVWFNDFDDDEVECYSTIAHECGHIAFQIMRYINVTIDDDDKEEVYLYLQQFYFNSIAPKLKKYFGKTRSKK